MRYRERPPPLALAPYVTCFWEITGGVGSHRVLPDGAMDVLVSAAGAARVIGPMTKAIVTPPGAVEAWVAGVRFRPGAAIEMLGVAARELRDETASAADVWGPPCRGLDAQLAEAARPSEAIALLEAELTSRLGRVRSPDTRIAAAVETLRAARGELPIPAVAVKVGLGERQLERLFDERVGYGPKTFARVVRMERAVASMTRGSIASWARFALACGYADQAHLIREFRALTGVTPAVYAQSPGVSEIDNPAPPAAATFRA